MFEDEKAYRLFAENLRVAQTKYTPDQEETLRQRQRKQVKKLIRLERDFSKALQKHQSGPKVYTEFFEFICETRRNILDARPYFRERAKTFTLFISDAFKKRQPKKIYRFRMNYSFVQWVLKARKWRKGSAIVTYANQIKKLRDQMVEENLPLAISQSLLFWNATPKAHLSFMDLVQIHSMALLLAVDKFAPEDDTGMSESESLAQYKALLGVAVGIMRRDRVNNYSATMVHLYPDDRQKLYWANKLLRYFPDGVDHEVLAEWMNADSPPELQTTGPEIANLLAGVNFVSSDVPNEEGDCMVDSFEASDDIRPDVQVENANLLACVSIAISKLSCLERKLLRLKGIKL